MFEVDLGRIKFKWMGDWNATTSYKPDDVVYHAGSSYVAVAPTTGNLPEAGSAFWDIMAVGSDLGALATSAGDLFYYNGSEFRRLAPGTNGQVLKMGVNGALQWIDPDLVSPVIQQQTYMDFNRATVGSGGYYYFGQSSTGVAITPKKYTSIIEVNLVAYGEPNTHDVFLRVQYSKDNGATWSNMRLPVYNEPGHLKLNVYETDYNSTPSSQSYIGVAKFETLNPVCFRVQSVNGTSYFNGAVSSSYEHAPSTISLKELNSDFSEIYINGGTG
jgi:hypothetical protein